ncbi:hypothetical protein [Streptomyces gibsoniae]|uniref:Uncharacterized protein n=1 Tax=Streptomyces gibsoniae TaxID=3075529 RepID=A0ABU2UAD9_9ACTN|nr:hypothetical protein [Streptomyces sp. DSM 41699]MDT0470130.1 hypothetical protein [Streptomyces sp. DSM 41699]
MCMIWSSRILNAADQIPGERGDRHERYRTWSMNPAPADTLLQTLLALSIHSLILDTIADGRPCIPETISQMRLADISHAATKRPSHELLAGLPSLGDDDHLSVNAVKVLIHDDASALPLARLSQMIRITLMQLTATLPSPDPACSHLVHPGETGTEC